MWTVAALYYTAVELENLLGTDRQRTENSITEATLIPVDCWAERANTSRVSTSLEFDGSDLLFKLSPYFLKFIIVSLSIFQASSIGEM